MFLKDTLVTKEQDDRINEKAGGLKPQTNLGQVTKVMTTILHELLEGKTIRCYLLQT